MIERLSEVVIWAKRSSSAETVLITNLLAGLFAKGDIATPVDVAMVFESWQSVNRLCSRPTLLHQHAA